MIGLNMTVIWGYIKFCWFMLDFHKYECYNLPHVTSCPGLPYVTMTVLSFKTGVTICDNAISIFQDGSHNM